MHKPRANIEEHDGVSIIRIYTSDSPDNTITPSNTPSNALPLESSHQGTNHNPSRDSPDKLLSNHSSVEVSKPAASVQSHGGGSGMPQDSPDSGVGGGGITSILITSDLPTSNGFLPHNTSPTTRGSSSPMGNMNNANNSKSEETQTGASLQKATPLAGIYPETLPPPLEYQDTGQDYANNNSSPNSTVLRALPNSRAGHLEDIKCELTVTDITVSDVWSKDKDITVEARRLGQTSFSYQPMFRVQGKTGKSIPIKNEGKVDFNLKNHRGLEFEIFGKKGVCCIKKNRHISTVSFDPRKAFDFDGVVPEEEQHIEITPIYSTDPMVTFNCLVRVERKENPKTLSLFREPFISTTLPADVKNLVRGIPVWDAADLDNNTQFAVAAHGLHMRHGELNLSCQVVLHNDLDLSSVLIYHQVSGAVTASFIIDAPTLAQMQQDFPDVQILDGDVAMMVKNEEGNWGLLIMGQDHRRGPGHTVAIFHHVDSRQAFDCDVTFGEQTSFSLGEISVDMVTGQMTVAAGCQDVSEYVTLGMSVGVLYVIMTGRMGAFDYTAQPSSASSTVERKRMTNSLAHPTKNRTEKRSLFNKYKISNTYSKATAVGRAKNHRKRRSLICTLLLACGLQQTNRNIYGRTPSSSINSTDSLIPRSPPTSPSHMDMDLMATLPKSNSYRPVFHSKMNDNVHFVSNPIYSEDTNESKASNATSEYQNSTASGFKNNALSGYHNKAFTLEGEVTTGKPMQATNHEEEKALTLLDDVLDNDARKISFVSSESDNSAGKTDSAVDVESAKKMSDTSSENMCHRLQQSPESNETPSCQDSAIGLETDDENADDNIIFIEHF